MKKWYIIFLFVFVLFFISCDNKELENTDPKPVDPEPIEPVTPPKQEEDEISLPRRLLLNMMVLFTTKKIDH